MPLGQRLGDFSVLNQCSAIRGQSHSDSSTERIPKTNRELGGQVVICRIKY